MRVKSLFVPLAALALLSCSDGDGPVVPTVERPDFYNGTQGYWVVNNSTDHDDGACEARDPTDSSKDCTLREAIAAAAPGDEIRFSFETDQTIWLTEGELVIQKSLSINGSSDVHLTLDGNGAHRVFRMDGTDAGSAPEIELSLMTIRNGSQEGCGGGIFAANVELSVHDVFILSNTATQGGGICHYGTGGHVSSVRLVGTVIQSNTAQETGGGIHNFTDLSSGSVARLTLVGGAVAENRAEYSGGGIYDMGGEITLSYATVQANDAGLAGSLTYGGGIHTLGGVVTVDHSTLRDNRAPSAGGIYSSGGDLTIENSTISGNAATGMGVGGVAGGIFNAGDLLLTFATVTANQAERAGGIYQYAGGFLELDASILAGNVVSMALPDEGPDLVRADGTETFIARWSLVGVADDYLGPIVVDPPGEPSLLGTRSAPADPGLLPLADNGGPTWTHALKLDPASPALDFVYCPAIAVYEDQRQVARPQGDACDIGAFESVEQPPNTPSGPQVAVTPDDETTGSESPVTLTFDLVTEAGQTTVASGEQPSAPDGFALGDPPTYFDIETTAAHEGPITICIDYSEIEYADVNQLRLLHFDDLSQQWEDVTETLYPEEQKICGMVESLSPFLVAQLLPHFGGFLPPVSEPPYWNEVQAGSVVPLKFTLGADFGTDLAIAVEWQELVCPTRQERKEGTPPTAIGDPQPVTPSSPLTFDPASGIYKWEWKTERSWKKTCAQVLLTIPDETPQGGPHKAYVKFE